MPARWAQVWLAQVCSTWEWKWAVGDQSRQLPSMWLPSAKIATGDPEMGQLEEHVMARNVQAVTVGAMGQSKRPGQPLEGRLQAQQLWGAVL